MLTTHLEGEGEGGRGGGRGRDRRRGEKVCVCVAAVWYSELCSLNYLDSKHAIVHVLRSRFLCTVKPVVYILK